MKKAQLMSQPLMYILIAIVSVVIIVFGVRYTMRLMDMAEDAEYIKFKENIDIQISSLYNKHEGSSVTYTPSSSHQGIATPTKVKIICVKDNNQPSDILTQTQNKILTALNDNMVIFSEKETKHFDIENLQPLESPLCFTIENSLLTDFTLTNKIEENTFVEISKKEE